MTSVLLGIHWFVAYTRSCQERKVAERLTAQGVEVYVPVQKERRQWSDRVKLVEKLIFPGLVFIRCTEKTRRESFKMVYGITGYLIDKTGEDRKPLVVPPKQMDDFMTVVRSLNGEETMTVVKDHIEKGDTVRIIRGPLKDFVCECVEIQNRHSIIIRLGLLGSVLVTVEASDVVKEG